MTAFTRLSLLALFCGSIAAPALALQAGIASVDITPKEPIWLGGYAARTHPSEGIRQHIFAKALTLRGNDGTTAILVTADLLGFTRELTDSVASRVERKYRVPRRLILFNASHTHSAPVIGKALKPTYPLTEADQAVIARYTASLEEQLVEVIGRSMASIRPAQLSFAQGLAGLAVNRRRVGNPEYSGVIDPDVPVLVVRGEDGAIRAVVFGYACHNTTLDDYLVNGDWAGYAQEAIETQFKGAVAMYVQGCGADANPLPRRTVALTIAHGKLIAAAVSEVVLGKMRAVEGPIQAAYREVDLPLETPPSREEFEKRAASASGTEQRHARFMLQLLAKGPLPVKHAWQAQVWKIGSNFTFLALGGEVVADYALRFKKQYGFRDLWVAGYSNDVFAYIPSRRVWEEGGYEGGGAMIPYGLPARFQSSVEDIIVEAVGGLMQSVK